MKTTAICVIAIVVVGCNKQSPSVPNNIENQVPSSKAVLVEPFRFTVTQVASEKLHQAMAERPGQNYVMVSVDVDDQKYCIGFHYKLGLTSDPSSVASLLIESNGINLAVEKKSSEFLTGTTLDWGTLSSGKSGFVFRNPNENKSIPDELR